MGQKNRFVKQEWYNQRRSQTHYFHIFDWTFIFVVRPAWNVLRSDPYITLYSLKFMHMEQAGLMAMMSDQWKSFKPMEPEKLQPLKLPHFYITMIGIVVGLFLAIIAFAVEKFAWAKVAKNNVGSKNGLKKNFEKVISK